MALTRRDNLDSGLNLIPIMNLVAILIPFLLMAAEFVQLAVVDSTLPSLAPAPTPVPTDVDTDLTLSLAITESGLTILGAEPVLASGTPAGKSSTESTQPTIPCRHGARCSTPEDYDWSELTRLLSLVKDEYPNTENVILVPDSHTPYEVIVRAMDATREDVAHVGSDGRPRPLFPAVILAGGPA